MKPKGKSQVPPKSFLEDADSLGGGKDSREQKYNGGFSIQIQGHKMLQNYIIVKKIILISMQLQQQKVFKD